MKYNNNNDCTYRISNNSTALLDCYVVVKLRPLLLLVMFRSVIGIGA
jgi:hypothetical protein